jgi:DNA (cytosine-5)-methyltransferase 1
MREPTFGSLFAGVGGFDIGLEAAGWRCGFQVEWDKHCQSILEHHWPDVPKWGDVCEVNGATLPPVDLITFGSPCQDLSVAGKRAGLQGGRSSMFFEATRIIKEMRNATNNVYPRTAIWENVTGALTSNGGADFGAVLDEMANIGALVVEWAVLDAQHFGVPQRRRRVFVVAIFDSATAAHCPDPLLPVREGRARDFAKGRKKGEGSASDVAGRIGEGGVEHADLKPIPIQGTIIGRSDTAGPEGSGIGDMDGAMYTLDRVSMHGIAQPIMTHDVVGALCARDYKGVGDQYVDEGKVITEAQPIIFDGTRHDDFRMDSEIVPTLKQRMGTGGGQVPMVAEPITVFQPGTMIRLSGGVWEDQVPTLRAEAHNGDNSPHIAQPYSFDTQFGSNANVFVDQSPTLKASQQSPSIATTMVVRRLTPIECERLMGWPDDHTRYTHTGKEQADTHRYKQCGNGVASPVAEWIGRHLHPLHTDTE